MLIPVGGLAIGGADGVVYGIGPLSFAYGETGASSHATAVAASPAADVVVGKHVTLGGRAAIGHGSSRQSDLGPGQVPYDVASTAVNVAPRIGIVERLGGGVFVWPRFALGVGRSWASSTGTPDEETTSVAFSVDVPFVFPLSRWVFVQAAPRASYTYQFAKKDAATFNFGSYVSLGLAL